MQDRPLFVLVRGRVERRAVLISSPHQRGAKTKGHPFRAMAETGAAPPHVTEEASEQCRRPKEHRACRPAGAQDFINVYETEPTP